MALEATTVEDDGTVEVTTTTNYSDPEEVPVEAVADILERNTSSGFVESEEDGVHGEGLYIHRSEYRDRTLARALSHFGFTILDIDTDPDDGVYLFAARDDTRPPSFPL